MSASGFTPIQLFRTTTAAAVPTAGSLAAGELAINLTDEALYFKNAAGVVTLLADSSGALGSVTSVNASGGTTGMTFSGGPITSSGTLTLGGTLAVANGGTGVTTSTGTGSVVLNTSPTLVTPALGVASADSIATLKGTVGSVAYGFIGNTNTGMWSPSSDAIAFSTAGSERLRVTSTGNVGIGTVSPDARLTVGGAISTSLGAVGTPSYAFTGDLNTGMWSPAADTLAFSTAGSERLRITDVGATLSQTAGTAVAFGTGTFSFDSVSIPDYGLAYTTAGSANAVLSAFGNIKFTTARAERMRIDQSGNVGIGTSSPGTRLQVADVAALSGFSSTAVRVTRSNYGADFIGYIDQGVGHGAIISTVDNGTPTERMRITNAGNVGIGTASPSERLDTGTGNTRTQALIISGDQHLLYSASATELGIRIGTGGPFYAIGTTGSSNMRINNASGGDMLFATATSERVRITNTGNVGIGITNPAARLQVREDLDGTTGVIIQNRNGSGTPVASLRFITGGLDLSDNRWAGITSQGVVAADLRFFTSAGGPVERMRIDSSGNVGIGTSSPQQTAAGRTVVGVNGSSSSLINIGSGGNFGSYWFWDGSTATLAANNSLSLLAGASPILFNNSGVERARIDSSGNLLVGTTSASGRITLGDNTGGVNGVVSLQSVAGGYSFLSDAANNGGSFYHAQFRQAGTPVGSITSSGSTTAYNTSSDYRLKDIDGPIQNSGAYIDALNPVQGSWKADGSRFIGLLAHEVQEVSETQIATGEKDGEEMQAMDYSAPEIIANLIAELQSLRARVAQLEGN